MESGERPRRQTKFQHGSSMNYMKWLSTKQKPPQKKKSNTSFIKKDMKYGPIEDRDCEDDVDPNAYGDW